jgi:hypothetical protein
MPLFQLLRELLLLVMLPGVKLLVLLILIPLPQILLGIMLVQLIMEMTLEIMLLQLLIMGMPCKPLMGALLGIIWEMMLSFTSCVITQVIYKFN